MVKVISVIVPWFDRWFMNELGESTNEDDVLLLSEPNPHMGHLAWADAFIVTADSVSMLSEVCSTGYAWVQYLNSHWWFRIYI